MSKQKTDRQSSPIPSLQSDVPTAVRPMVRPSRCGFGVWLVLLRCAAARQAVRGGNDVRRLLLAAAIETTTQGAPRSIVGEEEPGSAACAGWMQVAMCDDGARSRQNVLSVLCCPGRRPMGGFAIVQERLGFCCAGSADWGRPIVGRGSWVDCSEVQQHGRRREPEDL
ncbi:hypothetical protein B0H63DRAFT_228018 [Podospora didyma]|uniref:Uncharacterized protein n=1 Tax=Podospora didyma TaxID=330526 RepID=A0AAE0KKQ5_9PEZI|nr:hypothetical protein B0H63DRAFT_228018 [Podospora didyma]